MAVVRIGCNYREKLPGIQHVLSVIVFMSRLSPFKFANELLDAVIHTCKI